MKIRLEGFWSAELLYTLDCTSSMIYYSNTDFPQAHLFMALAISIILYYTIILINIFQIRCHAVNSVPFQAVTGSVSHHRNTDLGSRGRWGANSSGESQNYQVASLHFVATEVSGVLRWTSIWKLLLEVKRNFASLITDNFALHWETSPPILVSFC